MNGTKKGYCGDCSGYDRLAQVGDQDHFVCEECYPAYHQCSNCEEHKCHEDRDVKDVEGKWVCEECLDESYRHCEACGELHHQDSDKIKYDDNNDWFCEECEDEGHGYWEEHYRAIAGDDAYDRWRDDNL